MGMGNVLRARPESQEYQPSDIRQYAERPQYVNTCVLLLESSQK
jgi:hypothetical protein